MCGSSSCILDVRRHTEFTQRDRNNSRQPTKQGKASTNSESPPQIKQSKPHRHEQEHSMHKCTKPAHIATPGCGHPIAVLATGARPGDETDYHDGHGSHPGAFLALKSQPTASRLLTRSTCRGSDHHHQRHTIHVSQQCQVIYTITIFIHHHAHMTGLQHRHHIGAGRGVVEGRQGKRVRLTGSFGAPSPPRLSNAARLSNADRTSTVTAADNTSLHDGGQCPC